MNTPLKIGDKVRGGRLEKYYAIVEAITPEYVTVRYNGEVKTVKIASTDSHALAKAET